MKDLRRSISEGILGWIGIYIILNVTTIVGAEIIAFYHRLQGSNCPAALDWMVVLVWQIPFALVATIYMAWKIFAPFVSSKRNKTGGGLIS